MSKLLNPFSPNNDQHQISSCNTNAYSTPEVMRIKDMITQGEFSWYFNTFSPVLLYEKYGDKIGEFVLLILGIKGLNWAIELYLSMFSMIRAHPHATWHSCQRRVEAVHVKSQWAEIAVDKFTNKLTPTKKKKKKKKKIHIHIHFWP